MKSTAFLIFTGFMLTFGAVGGIENDAPLLDGVIIALVGLSIMAVGVLKMRREQA